MLQTFVRQKEVYYLFLLKNRVMLHSVIQLLYLDLNIIFECRHYFTFKKFFFSSGKIDGLVTTILCQPFGIVKRRV